MFTAEECLEKAVETAVTVRISKIADGDCSKIDLEGFKNIEEDRNNKRKFLKNAKAALAKGDGIPSSIFMDLDETTPSEMLTKDNLCNFMTKRNIKALKENVMQNCPEASELYEYGIHKDVVSDYSLAHVCNKIEQRKERICKESKIVYKTFSAPVPSNSSGGIGARATKQ